MSILEEIKHGQRKFFLHANLLRLLTMDDNDARSYEPAIMAAIIIPLDAPLPLRYRLRIQP
jgi:hypothetical protein